MPPSRSPGRPGLLGAAAAALPHPRRRGTGPRVPLDGDTGMALDSRTSGPKANAVAIVPPFRAPAGVNPETIAPGGPRTAQRRFGGFGGRDATVSEPLPNIPYDGRFTFVRVNYETGAGRLLVARPAVVGARLSARRAEPDADHERDQLPRRARRAINTLSLDDPRAVQVSRSPTSSR